MQNQAIVQELAPIQYPSAPLKWAGGKRWLIDQLKQWYDPERRLVDPFVGGMSVPLGLQAKKALICDVNPHLMNFHQHLRLGLHKDDRFENIEFENRSDIFYRNRDFFNVLASSRQFWTTEGALLFYYLNRTCFNGLCRFNRSGEFNVPFGSYKTINYQHNFGNYTKPLEPWELMCGDFETLPILPDDFIYADPPYDVEFTSFAQRDFRWEDQIRLARWLASHKGPVVASNQATARIMDLYRSLDFTLYALPGPRTISSSGDRTPALEILAIKGIA
jgi:DNA adenine methylase